MTDKRSVLPRLVKISLISVAAILLLGVCGLVYFSVNTHTFFNKTY